MTPIPTSSTAPCFVDVLPDELLAYIFRLGEEEIEDDIIEDRKFVNSKDAKSNDAHDSSESTDKGKQVDVVDVSDGDEEDEEWSDEDSDEEDPEDEALPLQFIVSHVCRRWREVVLGIPVLWSKLKFVIGFNKEWAVVCLERSKDAPLDINIDLEEEDEVVTARLMGEISSTKEVVDCMREIMDLIVPHVNHWSQLFVESTSFEAIHHMLLRLSSIESGAPRLELIHIGFSDESDIDSFETTEFPSEFRDGLKPFAGNLPALQELSLWEVHFDWSIFVPSPGRHSITNLRALELRYHTGDVRPSFDEFRACLLRSPKLESLVLFASAPRYFPEIVETRWYNDRIQLNHLVELTLATLSPRNIIALLRTLVMPSLRRLTVEWDEEDYTDAIIQLTAKDPDLVDSSGKNEYSIASRLVYLKLGSLSCSDDSLGQLYAQLNNVETMDLNMNFVPLHAGHLLVHAPTSGETAPGIKAPLTSTPLYCPKLRKLMVSGVKAYNLCTLAERRTVEGYPLEELYLDKNIPLDEMSVATLQKSVPFVGFVEYSDEEIWEDDDDDDDDGDDGDDDGEEEGEEV